MSRFSGSVYQTFENNQITYPICLFNILPASPFIIFLKESELKSIYTPQIRFIKFLISFRNFIPTKLLCYGKLSLSTQLLQNCQLMMSYYCIILFSQFAYRGNDSYYLIYSYITVRRTLHVKIK